MNQPVSVSLVPAMETLALHIWLPIAPFGALGIVVGAAAAFGFALTPFHRGRLGAALFPAVCFGPFYALYFLVERGGFGDRWRDLGMGWLVGFLISALMLSWLSRKRTRSARVTE